MLKKHRVPKPRASKPKKLVKFFADSPLAKAKIDLRRKRDVGRKIEL